MSEGRASALMAPYHALAGVAERVPHSVIALMTRVSVAMVFWKSGRTKVVGCWPGEETCEISDTAYTLFEYEYALPVIPYDLATVFATVAEHLFPVLLIIGLFSRFSALALLVMTLVIQVFVYPQAWDTHLLWGTALIYVLARGPGMVSADYVLGTVLGVARKA